MDKPKEVAIRKEDETSVASFILKAIEMKAPVETMERLFNLQKEFKAEKAKEEFVRSMAEFQSICPIIKKTKKVLNKDGTVRYMFAPLDSIVSQIQKPLAKCELSYRWNTKTEDKKITAICVVTHVLGHSESSDFSVDVDEGGFMTSPQKSASALTFTKRYSLCNALGISTGEEDDDSLSVAKEPEATSVKSKIIFLLKSLGKKATSKADIEKTVLALTGLDLKEANYIEIKSRLEVILQEHNEDKTVR